MQREHTFAFSYYNKHMFLLQYPFCIFLAVSPIAERRNANGTEEQKEENRKNVLVDLDMFG